MKYSEIIGVEKHFKSAFDITSDKGEAWKTFISNEKFEGNLSQIINCFTSPVYNNRKSIWIQGTYGTGKSHSLSVIKHLLCDDYSEIEDYLPRINRSQLRNSISTFRKEKKVFSVVLKGTYVIKDVADITYTIQKQVAEALGDIEITTKTDFQSMVQILEKGSLDSFFENLLENNVELRSYALNKKQLLKALENNDRKVLKIIVEELKKAGLGGIRTHNIIEWLKEVKNELEQKGIADYLLLIWDEFTSLLDIPARRSILNVMQDIAEMSASEVENGADTLGVYLLLVTHKKLEATQTYKDLKEDERNMAKARFVELDYGMQPTTTFHILSGALERKQPDVLNELVQKNFLEVPSVKTLVDRVVDNEAPNASEIKDKIISLYPFHPYTSYLATFVSRVVGEAERSIFGFLNDEENGFKKFILNEIEDEIFLTADYVWDFFYNTFEQNAIGHFDVITNKYKLAGETVREKGKDYYAIFKTILLLNILYRVTTTDADTSEKSMVNPSTSNILAAFSGVLEEGEVLAILDYIDEKQILHRNPDGVFEVASSALPQKKILEEKKKLYSGNRGDVSKIVEEYSIKCLGKLRTNVSRDVLRELDAQVFWGGEKEHLLRGKVSAKFKNEYSLKVALILYRGETKELDEILNSTEIDQAASKDIMIKISKEEEYKNIVFILVNTELGNKRFEAYLDSLAQEAVARSLQMDEERIEGQKKAEKWIAQWIDEIIASGMADIVFRGDVIHVPFNQCSKHLKNNYIGTIFKYGLDTLPAPNTAWKHQTSKSAVELVLYTPTKSELETKSGSDSVVRYLLASGNTMLFDERLQLVSDDSSIPVVKVCKEVDAVFEKNKNESSINLADELKFLVKPEYGYYQNRLFMGALALALRPYIDRLYTSGNGQRIDKTVMKDIVVAIFNYWENDKYSDKFVVRMSTEEERTLTDKLNMIFGITDQDGLLGTKWAIRTKFRNQSKAPLWALKYVGNCTDKYKEFIDKMFRFSKSTDDSIQQNFIIELLDGIKTFDVELSTAIASVDNVQCLDNYLVKELSNIGESEESLQSVKQYLADKMPGEIVFWEEQDVHEQILLWKIKVNAPAENVSPVNSATNVSNDLSEDNQQGNEHDGSNNTVSADDVDELKISVKSKVENNKMNSEKLYRVLVALVEKYPSILKDIDELL